MNIGGIGSTAAKVGNKISQSAGKGLDKVANTKFVSNYLNVAKEDPAKFMAKMALFSFVSKDFINCVVYTAKSWNNKKLENPSITDTEAIELASLIEDLQDEIIVDYYKYKGALTKLKKCREQLLLHNKNFSNALSRENSLDISITSSQWEDELIEEYKLKQEALKYQLALIRLAGKQTVENLNVAQFDLTVQNINPKDLNYERKTVNVQMQKEDKSTK